MRFHLRSSLCICSDDCFVLFRSNGVENAPNPRYFYGTGRKNKDDKDTILFVYDILEDKVIREHVLSSESSRSIEINTTSDPNIVSLTSGYHGFIVDVDSGKVIQKLNTALHKYSKQFVFVTKRNELVTITKGKKFLKIIDLATGNVSCILKSDQTQNIDTLQVNDAGTMATAQIDEGPMLIFDIENREYLYSVSNKDYDEYFATSMLVNDKKTHVLFSTDKPIPGFPKANDVTQAVVWDFEKRKEVCKLNDRVVEQKLSLSNTGDSTSLDTMYFLDDTRVISSHYDNVIRVFNYYQGTLLNRLTGHTSSPDFSVRPDGPYVFSYGSLVEEDCFKLWDKNTFKCVASYTLDTTVTSTYLSSDGRFVVGRSHKPVDLLRWDIVHADPYMDYKATDYSEDFKGEVTGNTLDIEFPETYVPDPNDPDSDPKLPSDDEIEDDDEDD